MATPGRFLDQFTTILLDMNSTFMFGEDRFGADEDFFATYKQFGGVNLDRLSVNAAIRCCYTAMSQEYEDPLKIDDFPSLREGLERYTRVENTELALLEAVFAYHELGHIPDAYAACLQRLSRSHRLGVVSNIWAKKPPWLAEFKRAEISDLWDVVIFSSDSRSIKPSHTLFHAAVDKMNVPLAEIIFVGDSLRVDMVPARSFGLATVWLHFDMQTHPLADIIVPSLLELETLI